MCSSEDPEKWRHISVHTHTFLYYYCSDETQSPETNPEPLNRAKCSEHPAKLKTEFRSRMSVFCPSMVDKINEKSTKSQNFPINQP